MKKKLYVFGSLLLSVALTLTVLSACGKEPAEADTSASGVENSSSEATTAVVTSFVPLTESVVVTDEDGEEVTDEKGTTVTAYVPVTEDSGKAVTEMVTEIVTETVTEAAAQTAAEKPAGDNSETKGGADASQANAPDTTKAAEGGSVSDVTGVTLGTDDPDEGWF